MNFLKEQRKSMNPLKEQRKSMNPLKEQGRFMNSLHSKEGGANLRLRSIIQQKR
jgi:hypothetical protein